MVTRIVYFRSHVASLVKDAGKISSYLETFLAHLPL